MPVLFLGFGIENRRLGEPTADRRGPGKGPPPSGCKRPVGGRISQPPLYSDEEEEESQGVTRNPPHNRKGEERKLYS
jgi:hypothetical protein